MEVVILIGAVYVGLMGLVMCVLAGAKCGDEAAARWAEGPSEAPPRRDAT